MHRLLWLVAVCWFLLAPTSVQALAAPAAGPSGARVSNAAAAAGYWTGYWKLNGRRWVWVWVWVPGRPA
jgi:hypothetical protein